jgi:hypothetical protein
LEIQPNRITDGVQSSIANPMGLSEYLLRETLGFNMAPTINAMKHSDLFGQPPVRSCNSAFDHANALKSALERYNRSRGSHRRQCNANWFDRLSSDKAGDHVN